MRRVFHSPKVPAIDLLPMSTITHAWLGVLERVKRGVTFALSVVEPKASDRPSLTRTTASATLWKELNEVESANATWEGVVSLVLMLAFAALLVTATLRS